MLSMLGTAVGVLALGVGAVFAQPLSTAHAVPLPISTDESQVEQVAASLSLSIDEAKIVISEQTAFSLEVSQLSKQFGPRTLEAWIDKAQPRLFNMRTTNTKVLKEARTWAASTGLSLNLFEGAPISPAPLPPFTVAAIQEAYPEMDGIYRDESGLLHVSAQGPAHAPRTAVSDVPEGISVTWGTRTARNSGTVYGGNALGSCTVGFSASYGATQGFYTAAHCGSPQSYYAGATTGIFLATGYVVSSRYDADSDIEMLSVASGDGSSPYYRGSDLGLTRVLGQTSAVTNGTYCFRGRSTGWKCGQVVSIYYKPTYSNACPSACNNSFILMNIATIPGDSGGPLVTGNYATGIVKGVANGGGVFSKIALTPGASTLKT